MHAEQEAAAQAADEVDPLAQQIGAVNTLVRQPHGKLKGYNTDCSGGIAAIETALGGTSPLQVSVQRRCWAINFCVAGLGSLQ